MTKVYAIKAIPKGEKPWLWTGIDHDGNECIAMYESRQSAEYTIGMIMEPKHEYYEKGTKYKVIEFSDLMGASKV